MRGEHVSARPVTSDVPDVIDHQGDAEAVRCVQSWDELSRFFRIGGVALQAIGLAEVVCHSHGHAVHEEVLVLLDGRREEEVGQFARCHHGKPDVRHDGSGQVAHFGSDFGVRSARLVQTDLRN